MSFDPEVFMSSPDVEAFEKLKKEDLISLGRHLDLTVKTGMRKITIQNIIANYLVTQECFNPSVLQAFELPATDLEIKKLEIQAQIQKEREEREIQAQKEEREIQAQLEIRKMELEFEMKKLELAPRALSVSQNPDKFDVTKHIRLVPPFQEKDVDKYFLHFEKIAENLRWPRDFWPMLLQSVLIGKAREIYTQLSIEQASNYDTIKELVLKGYELVPEAYRQKFRTTQKQSDQTYVEFARAKEQLFDRWCTSKKIEKNHEKLRQLILVEEFKNCVITEIKTFIDEQKAETLENAARLADDYSLTHKTNFVNKTQKFFRNPNSSFSNYSAKPRNDVNYRQNFGPNPVQTPPKSYPPAQKPFKPLSCNYCKKEGHLISDCYRLKQKKEAEFKYFVKIYASF